MVLSHVQSSYSALQSIHQVFSYVVWPVIGALAQSSENHDALLLGPIMDE